MTTVTTASMRENGFVEAPAQTSLADVLTFRRQTTPGIPDVIGVAPDEPVVVAIEWLHSYGISQLPVMENGRIVGSLTETQLLQRLDGQRIGEWQGPPLPTLPEYQGRRYITEAARAYVAWAFTHPELKWIFAMTQVENARSQRILEKLGARQFKDEDDDGSGWLDWELLPEDFARANGRL